VLEEWRSAGGREQTRVTERVEDINRNVILILFTALLVTGATAAMVVPAGSQQYGVVSAEFTSERPNVIPMGESKNQLYPVGNGGVIPVIAYIEPARGGVEVEPQEVRVGGRSVTNATVTLHAPPETGYYRRFIVEHRYLALLPQPVIHGLYQIHPWAPIVAIDALIGVPFYLIGITLVGTGPVRQRTSSRDTSTAVRLTRLVRNIYR
jgi:signal peptidase